MSGQPYDMQALRAVLTHAQTNAPAVAEVMRGAGTRPEAVASLADLASIPVTKKETLLELQRRDPPFGGFLACDPKELSRIYVSPGPVYDPQARGERGHGFAQTFGQAGVGPGDIFLNTWSYHLVPAGLLIDEGLQELGVTVIPSGVGNLDLQADLIMELGVTGIAASTAFFQALVDKLVEKGHRIPQDWKVRHAFLGGEFGDWMGKRRRLEREYDIKTFSCYATADFGVIAYEDGQEGYRVVDNRIVQICDPDSGAVLPAGEPGEIVVTALSKHYPLIRLGTGDVCYALESTDCGQAALRLSLLQGRTGQAVKAREIFIYPRQLEELVIRTPGLARAQAVIARPQARDQIELRLEREAGAAVDEDAIRSTFTNLSRLRADQLTWVEEGSIPAEGPLVMDTRG